jgi:hypothetical protein
MGEAAEDILEGCVCEVCGEWFDDVLDGEEPPGHPRRCERCEPTWRRKARRRRGRRMMHALHSEYAQRGLTAPSV